MEHLPIAKRIEALQQTHLFGGLTDDVLRKIAGAALFLQLKRDHVLYSQEDEASGLYIVVSGEFRSVRQSAEGREQVLSTERAGAVLAAVPVFNGGKFYSTMIADSDSEVLCIAKTDIHALCREHTQLMWNLVNVLAQKVRHYAELVEMLALKNVEQRLARYLFAVAHERGVRVRTGCVVELTLTRSEIASRIGSVREVVSRSFAHLQEKGLIEVQGWRLITIPDMQKLRTFADAPGEKEVTLISTLSAEVS